MLVGLPALFVPSTFELVACAAMKTQVVSLLIQEPVLTITPSAVTNGSAFGVIPPKLPVAGVSAGNQPTLTLSFNPDPTKDRQTQVITVSATASAITDSFPLICWVADTVLPNELGIVNPQADLNVDPVGPDLPLESVKITNVSNRDLDLTGCTLSNNGGIHDPSTGMFPSTYSFPFGFRLSQGAAVTVNTKHGNNTPTQLFWGQNAAMWHNDFDTGIVQNFASDTVFRFFYLFTLAPQPIPGQTKIFDRTLFVDQHFASLFSGIILEDGDQVVLQPDLSNLSRSSAGTGPAGESTNAPDGDNWPLPGAPIYALLAQAGGANTLVGSTTLAQVVNRTSSLRPDSPLNLLLNQNQPAGFGVSGGYWVRIRVFRI